MKYDFDLMIYSRNLSKLQCKCIVHSFNRTVLLCHLACHYCRQIVRCERHYTANFLAYKVEVLVLAYFQPHCLRDTNCYWGCKI